MKNLFRIILAIACCLMFTFLVACSNETGASTAEKSKPAFEISEDVLKETVIKVMQQTSSLPNVVYDLPEITYQVFEKKERANRSNGIVETVIPVEIKTLGYLRENYMNKIGFKRRELEFMVLCYEKLNGELKCELEGSEPRTANIDDYITDFKGDISRKETVFVRK